MQIRWIRSALLVSIILSTFLYGFSNIIEVQAAGPLTGSFTSSPQNPLVGGNDTFTGVASGGTPPYKFNWTFGDGPLVENGSFVTHIYNAAGTFTVSLNITDSTPTKITISNTITVQGSPLNIDGWHVEWKITPNWGIEVGNITYNTVPVIRDAFVNGILVRYWSTPPGLPASSSCYFFDNLGSDDLAHREAGFNLQYSTNPPDPWFEIRTQFQPGYNYTEIWRFHTNGEWDAILYVGHLGCGWNHSYQPHFRIDLAVGNKNRDVMGQYSPGGIWRNLVWEGNYTANASRDTAHNSTEWRIGDGQSYYYFAPSTTPWAPEMPRVDSKVYLVRDRPGEVEPNYGNDIPPAGYTPDPITFANGELAYRQSIAFWFLPEFWDHWTGLNPGFVAPASFVSLSFYPNGI